LQVKKIRFHTGEPSKNKRHAGALRREEKREEYQYLYKTGQLKEEPKKKSHR
jgi:hypothetical protein